MCLRYTHNQDDDENPFKDKEKTFWTMRQRKQQQETKQN
jgi:hypothetical protein